MRRASCRRGVNKGVWLADHENDDNGDDYNQISITSLSPTIFSSLHSTIDIATALFLQAEKKLNIPAPTIFLAVSSLLVLFAILILSIEGVA